MLRQWLTAILVFCLIIILLLGLVYWLLPQSFFGRWFHDRLSFFNHPCAVMIDSSQVSYQVQVVDQKLFQTFLASIAPCQDGQYQVHLEGFLDQVFTVKQIKINYSPQLQIKKKYQNNVLQRSFDSSMVGETAVLIFNYPAPPSSEVVWGGLVLELQKLFVNSNKVDLLKYSSLSTMGLSYEKK